MKTEKISLGVLAVVVSAVASGCGAAMEATYGGYGASGGGLNASGSTPPERPAQVTERVHHYGTRVGHMTTRSLRGR